MMRAARSLTALSRASRNVSFLQQHARPTVLPAQQISSSMRQFTAFARLSQQAPKDALEATSQPTGSEENVKADSSSTDPIAEVASPLSSSSSSSSSSAPSAVAATGGATKGVTFEDLASSGAKAAEEGLHEPTKRERPTTRPTAEREHRVVFVAKLSWDVDEVLLQEQLEDALALKEGDIESVRLARDQQGRPKGFAFVQFATPELAARALALDFSLLSHEGHEPVLRLAEDKQRPQRPAPTPYSQRSQGGQGLGQPRNPPARTVWLGNIPWSTTQEDLHELLGHFGEIQRVTVPTDRETGRARGIAYVEFLEQDSAERVLERAGGDKGLHLEGRSIRVDYAERSQPQFGAPRNRFGRDGESRDDRRGRWNNQGRGERSYRD